MNIPDFHTLLDAGSAQESQAPFVLNGRELQELISPVACEEFVNSYFSRASLNVEGHPQKFGHIFSWEKLKHALARGQKIRDRRFNIMASFAAGEEAGSRRPMFEAHIGQVSELLNAGATICITNIHMADPFLARWAQAIRGQLNFTGTVGVNCYVSPDGAGLPMHYDKRVATTLQIAGKKRWKFSTEPAKPWPGDNAAFEQGRIVSSAADPGRLPADMEFREVELKPGDLLCLPAGAWHAARGVGASLALNLYFAPRNLFDQLAPLLLAAAASNEHWRGGPPATVEKIQGRMPQTVAAYMRERLDEFHRKALEIIDSPDAMAEPWLNALTQGPYTGWKPDPAAPLPRATAQDRFRVAIAPLRFIETPDKVMVPCEHGVLSFPAAMAPIFRRLSSIEGSFTVPDALSWQNGLAPAEIIPHLQTLFKNRILEMTA